MREQEKSRFIIHERLLELQAKNPLYSLRAFAKSLGIPQSALSEILSGKRRISKKMGVRMLKGLLLSPEKETIFLNSIDGKLIRDSLYRKPNQERTESTKLTNQQFNAIADWKHFAFLSLIEIEQITTKNIEWAAKRLETTTEAIQNVITNLIDLELIKLGEDGVYSRLANPLKTSDGVANLSVRKSHLEDLDRIRMRIHKDIHLHDFTSLTFPFSPALLPQAKEIIRRAQDELEELAKNYETTEVYRSCSYFYPLTTHVSKSKITGVIQ